MLLPIQFLCVSIVDAGKNPGLLNARIVGAGNARADYVIFVDAGDQIESDACRQIADWIREERSDIIEFNCGVEHSAEDLEDIKRLKESLRTKAKTCSSLEILKTFFEDRPELPLFEGKAFRRDVLLKGLTQIKSANRCIGEDAAAFFLLRMLFSFLSRNSIPASLLASTRSWSEQRESLTRTVCQTMRHQ